MEKLDNMRKTGENVLESLSIEGIYSLDRYQVGVLDQHFGRIADIEKAIDSNIQDAAAAELKKDHSGGPGAEATNRAIRLAIKGKEHRRAGLEADKRAREGEVAALMDQKMDEMFDFEKMLKTFSEDIRENGSQILKYIEQEDAPLINEIVEVDEQTTKDGKPIKKSKHLNDLEKETLGLDADILYQEDLNFQAFARHYTMKKGDFTDGVDYSETQMNTKEQQAVVYDQISAFSVDKDSDSCFKEGRWDTPWDGRADGDPLREMSLESAASRHNFWCDLGQHDHTGHDRVFGHHRGGMAKGGCGRDGFGDRGLGGRRARLFDIETVKMKMLRLRAMFEFQKGKMQAALFEEADKLFRQRSKALAARLREEAVALLRQFHKLRVETRAEREKVAVAHHFALNQENIINELR